MIDSTAMTNSKPLPRSFVPRIWLLGVFALAISFAVFIGDTWSNPSPSQADSNSETRPNSSHHHQTNLSRIKESQQPLTLESKATNSNRIFPAVVQGSARSAMVSRRNLPTNSIIRFNGRRYGFKENSGNLLADFQRTLRPDQSRIILLGLLSPPSPALNLAWVRQGVDLLSYVPDNGWIARIYGLEQPAAFGPISFFKPLDAAMRIQESLLVQNSADAEVPVYVHVVRDRQALALLPEFSNAGFNELTVQAVGESSYLAGTIPGDQLSNFLAIAAGHSEVQFIEQGGRARLLNDDARRTTQSGDYLGPTPLFDQGIYGSNQVIAVCDTGLDIDSCFFRNEGGAVPPTNRIDGTNVNLALRKVVAANFLYPLDDPALPIDWDNHGHGTSVAGCAVGSDIYDPWRTDADNGMAPGAKLIIQDAGFVGGDACADLIGLGCPVTNFYPVLMQAARQGAVIHNNSWGDQEDAIQQNIYTEACRELDLVTWSNKQFLVVCASTLR